MDVPENKDTAEKLIAARKRVSYYSVVTMSKDSVTDEEFPNVQFQQLKKQNKKIKAGGEGRTAEDSEERRVVPPQQTGESLKEAAAPTMDLHSSPITSLEKDDSTSVEQHDRVSLARPGHDRQSL